MSSEEQKDTGFTDRDEEEKTAEKTSSKDLYVMNDSGIWVNRKLAMKFLPPNSMNMDLNFSDWAK